MRGRRNWYMIVNLVGRTHPEQEIHVDLSSDLKVSHMPGFGERVNMLGGRFKQYSWHLGERRGTVRRACSGPTDEVRIGGAVMRFRYDNGHSAMKQRNVCAGNPRDDDCAFEALDSYPVYKEESYRYFEPGHRKKTDLDSVLKSRKSPMGRIRPNGQLALSESGRQAPAQRSFWTLPELVAQIHRAKNNEALADWFVNGVTDGYQRQNGRVLW